MRTLSIVIGLGIAGLLTVSSAVTHSKTTNKSVAAQKEGAVVDANGNLRVPADYRTAYQFLGGWAIADDKGQGSKGMHFVYASPGSVTAFRKDGHFPDGSVLVKEVYKATTQSMTTGTVSRAQQLQGWFVMVKESKDTHPDNKLWGDGWAWSWFDAGNPTKTTSTDFRLNCLSCHEPARGTDLIYLQGYPPLNP